MVVLDGAVVTIGNTQYLQPDYLSPLPSSLDAKNSPLALLAQTCSQIGSDNSNSGGGGGAGGASNSAAVKALLDKGARAHKGESGKSPTAAQKLIMESSVAAAAHASNRSSPSTSPHHNTKSPASSRSSHSNGSSTSPPAGHKIGLNSRSAGVVDSNNNNSNGANSSEIVKLAFKPYESEVLSKSSVTNNNKCKASNSDKCNSPGSSSSPAHPNNQNDHEPRKCPSNRSATVSTVDENQRAHQSSQGHPSSAQQSPPPPPPSMLRNGMDLLQSEFYKMSGLPSPYGGLVGYPPPPSSGGPSMSGLDPQDLLINPAFRPPFATPSGYPSPLAGYHHPALSPYFAAYAGGAPAPSGMKPSDNGVGVCKDPNCTGCQYSAAAVQHHHQQMMMGVPCPAGCLQCQHQKYNMAMAAIHSSYQMAAASAAAASQQPQRLSPLVCNWVNGDNYCGKKFNSGDDLMQHLKTHTAGLSDPTAAATALIQAQLLQQHHHHQQQQQQQQGFSVSAAMFPQTSPLGNRGGGGSGNAFRTTPPLSPSAAAAALRYHPYGKAGPAMSPSAMPPSHNGGGGPYSSFNPALFSPYYSPYAFYGQRLGPTAAVHQ